jgi:peptide/nickel transport system ATP-binding protein
MRQGAAAGKRILSVKDLVVEYAMESETVHAVNGVSFDLNYGETLGLVGETGAGKTTTAKSILRILPDPPARIRNGQVVLDDADLLAMTDEQVRRLRGKRMSMIFQDPMTALNPIMRVGNQIAEGIIKTNHVSKREAREQAVHMLEMVGIPADRFREYPHQFSGGMRQRVVIAIALACNPDLLIADEPTTALDVTIQAQVLELIKDMHRRYNMTMILITHDFGVVAETCNNIAVVYAGQIIEYGTTRQVFKQPKHPYTMGLFNAVPKMTDVDRLRPIFGRPPDPTNLPRGCYFSLRCPYVFEECRKSGIPITTLEDGHQCRCLRYSGSRRAGEGAEGT